MLAPVNLLLPPFLLVFILPPPRIRGLDHGNSHQPNVFPQPGTCRVYKFSSSHPAAAVSG